MILLEETPTLNTAIFLSDSNILQKLPVMSSAVPQTPVTEALTNQISECYTTVC